MIKCRWAPTTLFGQRFRLPMLTSTLLYEVLYFAVLCGMFLALFCGHIFAKLCAILVLQPVQLAINLMSLVSGIWTSNTYNQEHKNLHAKN